MRKYLIAFTVLCLFMLSGLAVAQDTITVPLGSDPEVPEYVDGSFIAIYKDFNAWWGENKAESILQNELGLVSGVDYAVYPTSSLKTGISPDIDVVIITANSYGWLSTMENVNDPDSQANLEAFVEGGGILVMHLADNLLSRSFKAPGIPERTVNGPYGNDLNLVAPGDHAIVLGPDGLIGTADDLTQSNIQWKTGASAHHGILPPLPADATIFFEDNNGNPLWAEYCFGAGLVIVSDLTLEYGNDGDPGIIDGYGFPRRVLLNELNYAVYVAHGCIIEASININPNTLNRKSKGKWITAYIELLEDYDINEIDVSTVQLIYDGNTVEAEWGDVQGDAYMVKFNRAEVQTIVTPGEVELTITGSLFSGIVFEGLDTIRVIN